MKTGLFSLAVARVVRGMGIVVGVFSVALAFAPLSSQAVYTGTLADLATSGGSLTVDDKTFSGFSYQFSGLVSFDPSQITVTASQLNGIDYLTWSGNISFTGGDVSTADLLLNYTVSASSGSIDMIDQGYTGTATGSGLLAITETAATNYFSAGIVAVSQLSNYDFNDPPAESNDVLNIVPPQTFLYVTKDIALAIPNTTNTLVTISQITQSFHQVPEPNPLLLGSLGGGLLLFLKLRRRTRHG